MVGLFLLKYRYISHKHQLAIRMHVNPAHGQQLQRPLRYVLSKKKVQVTFDVQSACQ